MKPRTSNMPRESVPRYSIISGNQIPILTPEEIQKLNALKRASINQEKDLQKIEEAGRKSIRPSKRHSLTKTKKITKVQPKEQSTQKDEIETKRTNETSFSSKSNKKRVDKAIKEKEQGFISKCCNLKGKEQEQENPFRKARQSYLKN